MSDFETFVANLVTDVDRANTETETYVKRATVRALKRLSPLRTLLMEDVFSFTAVVGQGEYDVTDSGFPPDPMWFELIYIEDNSTVIAMHQERIEKVLLSRGSTFAAEVNDGYLWAWHADQLWLAPVPTQADVIKGIYFKDATKDSATGNEITTSSTTQTNPWFVRGEDVLRCSVLSDYYQTHAKDQEAASMMRSQFVEAIGSLEREYWLQHSGARSPFVY